MNVYVVINSQELKVVDQFAFKADAEMRAHDLELYHGVRFLVMEVEKDDVQSDGTA